MAKHTYLFSIGIEHIYQLDDTLEMELSLSDKEIAAIVKHGEYMVDKGEDNESWNYIEECLPKTYQRFCALAKIEAQKKYDDTVDLSRAHYVFFVPDDIWDMITQTNGYKEYHEKCNKIEESSSRRWEREKVIFSDKIKQDKYQSFLYKDEPYSGGFYLSWDIKADYYLQINFTKISKLTYSKRYTLDGYYVEIESNCDSFHEWVKEKLQEIDSSRNFRMRHGRLTYDAHEDDSDIVLFFELFDRIIADLCP